MGPALRSSFRRPGLVFCLLIAGIWSCESSDKKTNPAAATTLSATVPTPPLPPSVAQPSPALPASGATIGAAEAKAKAEKLLPELRKMASAEAVKKAVIAQNKQHLTLDQIKKADAEWIASVGVTDKIKTYIENPCALSLEAFESKLPAIVEAFAMDNQGALVCTVNRTSDYWQGDEDKWQKSFANGAGAEFIDTPKFDESSQSYSTQVSLPVMEGGRAVGAITVGLRVDKI